MVWCLVCVGDWWLVCVDDWWFGGWRMVVDWVVEGCWLVSCSGEKIFGWIDGWLGKIQEC